MYVFDLIDKKKILVQISKAGNSDLKSNPNFEFDWNQEIEFEVYKIEPKDTKEILGLMSLKVVFEELRIEIRLIEIQKNNVGKSKKYENIAGILIGYACKRAFDYGFYGFVSLIPKTKLQEHYQTKYGFEQFGRHLAIQLEKSELIMNKYLTNE